MKSGKPHNSLNGLLVEISKIRRNKSNELLSGTGVHAGQDILLYYLDMEDGQTVSALVEKMGIQQGTIAAMIERMVNAGMITKKKDAADKRISRVFITKKGKAAHQQVTETWRKMESITAKGLSPIEQAQLITLLEKVRDNLS
ncbi:MAG: winged helix-turn-helix transcriptional regulator [Chitinophaga sp.]|uniref:MarR family winged helix-turn-helix transcriptional regulator n=1 Tax=Chitinophaga sp. TaxID=1869181 RepID=UPI0025B7C520|nr:MarR family winged helix-turn-helix transcriptional regulator [Chitinophaga sp.]MBV8255538.1 winged helix-turn-helix transcriptional regulator [Chitinophaga sp.]